MWHCPMASKLQLARLCWPWHLIIDQVHDGNLAGTISKGTLLPSIELAMQCFQAAFPEVSLIKKWHWLLHMPDTQQRFGFPPSCFANERKHKPIGQLATSLQNKKKFETNLLDLGASSCQGDLQLGPATVVQRWCAFG